MLDQAVAASNLLAFFVAKNRSFRLGQDMEKRLHELLHSMSTIKNYALRLALAAVLLAYCKGSSKAILFVNSDVDSIVQHLASLCKDCVERHDSNGFVCVAELALVTFFSKKQALLLPNAHNFLSERFNLMVTPLAAVVITVLEGRVVFSCDELAAKVCWFSLKPFYVVIDFLSAPGAGNEHGSFNQISA